MILRSITLEPLKLPSAVNKILHSESLILAASAVDENPAKTTECTAPTLAHAKTAIVKFWDHWHIQYKLGRLFLILFFFSIHLQNLQTSPV